MIKKRKTRKKKQVLKGFIQSGTIFIGDIGYMAGDNSQSAEPIQSDPLNPFKDLDTFLEQTPTDTNLELPGSFNGDLPGRGVVLHTGMLNGSYTVKKRFDKVTGKLLEVKVRFHD